MSTDDKPPKPLITRHDVRYLYDLCSRLYALGNDTDGHALHELTGRVSQASKALMGASDTANTEPRPIVAEAVCEVTP